MTITEQKPMKVPADAGAAVTDDVIDAVMANVDAGGLELLGPNGVLAELTKRILERGLSEELSDHLGYEPGDPAGRGSGNNRNGTSAKTVLTEIGAVDLDIPRDRLGTFDPKLVPKGARRLEGFNANIVHLYARGMSTRDIRRELGRMYGIEVSPALISRVTDGIVEELNEWQARPLEAVYAVMYIDALVVKVRTQGTVTNRAAYLAVGVDLEGRKHVLGVWLGDGGEGAKFWLTDAPMLVPAVARIKQRFTKAPRAVTADRGYGEAAIDAGLEELGVKTVAIPRKGRPGLARQKTQRAKGFVKLVKWRTGSEARISRLKRDYGWSRTRIDGLAGAQTWCGWSVLAHNATKITALINADPQLETAPRCRSTDPPPDPHDAIAA